MNSGNRNQKETSIKLAELKRVLPVLLLAPYTKILFLAGSVAENSARLESDIDLVVVSQNNRVWLNKFFLEILTRIFKIKRAQNNLGNKICFNIFLASNKPILPHRDFVGASCYKNLKPVWGQADEIKKFWEKNHWIKKFYKDKLACEKILSEPARIYLAPKKILEFFLTLTGLGFILEKISCKIQTRYLKNKLNQSAAHKNPADYDFFITPHLIAYHFPVSNYAQAKKLAETAVENRPRPSKII